MSHACHRFWKCYRNHTFESLLTRCRIHGVSHTKRRLNVQKWSKHGMFFYILTSKCASRHNGVRFFPHLNIRKCPNMVCLARFGFQVCFAPQPHAIFQLSSSQMARRPPLWRACFATLWATKRWKKHSVSPLSTFSLTLIFFLLTPSLLCSSFLFFLFSDSSHLCCFICPFCWKFDFWTFFYNVYPCCIRVCIYIYIHILTYLFFIFLYMYWCGKSRFSMDS